MWQTKQQLSIQLQSSCGTQANPYWLCRLECLIQIKSHVFLLCSEIKTIVLHHSLFWAPLGFWNSRLYTQGQLASKSTAVLLMGIESYLASFCTYIYKTMTLCNSDVQTHLKAMILNPALTKLHFKNENILPFLEFIAFSNWLFGLT